MMVFFLFFFSWSRENGEGKGEGGGGTRLRTHALFQPDVVGDFGQGAFALLLQPGVCHFFVLWVFGVARGRRLLCGWFWGRMHGMGMGGGIAVGDGMFTEASCLQLGVFG